VVDSLAGEVRKNIEVRRLGQHLRLEPAHLAGRGGIAILGSAAAAIAAAGKSVDSAI